MQAFAVTGAIALLLAGLIASPAAARHRHHHRATHVMSRHCAATPNSRDCQPAMVTGAASAAVYASAAAPVYASADSADDGAVIGGRPAGCPHAYCGCGLRKYLGLSDERLNLAHNWARFFPHEARPRAGLVAVRAHHVMYLEEAAGAGQWRVRDFNSGGGLSRLHVRDVRGYVFVNPRAVMANK